ncbi:12773_t:CDS:2, partial [Acaulospora colombiana]
MSGLQKSAMQARLAKLPYIPTVAPPYDDEEDVEEREEAIPTPERRSLRSIDTPDLSAFSPISASGYFSQAVQVKLDNRGIELRVYYSPAVPQSGAEADGPSTVMEVTRLSNGECGVLAFDARRHGADFRKTIPLDGQTDEDLDIETLAKDLEDLLVTLFPDPIQSPTFILVGHSMGGAACVKTCPVLQSRQYRVSGVAVLDVVEGSALEALPIMMGLLDSRPDGFGTQEEAVQW